MLAVRLLIYCGCPSVVSSIFPASNDHIWHISPCGIACYLIVYCCLWWLVSYFGRLSQTLMQIDLDPYCWNIAARLSCIDQSNTSPFPACYSRCLRWLDGADNQPYLARSPPRSLFDTHTRPGPRACPIFSVVPCTSHLLLVVFSQ